MSSLNFNFKFYLRMIIILLLFSLSTFVTYSSMQRTSDVTNQIDWWSDQNLSHFINLDFINLMFITITSLIGAFFAYSICYLMACVFIYSLIKTVSVSNNEFIKRINKKSPFINMNIIL